MAGVDIVHVPHKGSDQARTAVLGGQVDMMFDAISTIVSQAQRGKLKALGTTRQAPLGGDARRADHRRSRRAGLRGDDLARPDGARRNAAAGDRAS